jgi:hypothetical protein
MYELESWRYWRLLSWWMLDGRNVEETKKLSLHIPKLEQLADSQLQ